MDMVLRYGRYYDRNSRPPRGKSSLDIDWPGTIWRYMWVSALSFAIYLASAALVYATKPSRTTYYSSYDYIKAAGLDAVKGYHLQLGAPTSGGAVGTSKTT